MQLAVGAEQLAPTGQYLVAVGLVPHIPYDAVVRGVQHIVQGHGQLHHAQARRQVAGVHRQLLHDGLPQLIAHLRQLVYCQPSQVGGVVYMV